MKDDNVFRAASGLTGGIGGLNDTCGSLLGSSMIMGVVFGRPEKDTANKDKLMYSMALAGMLYKWYEKEFGSVKCRDICTRFAGGVFYDRNIPWQAELMKEARIDSKCDDLVQKTAAKAAEMIWDGLHKSK